MTEQLHFSELWPHWPELLAGLWVTVQLTVLATIGGLAIGILGAAIRSGRPGMLSRVWGGYVEIIRNTPFVVQLFFIVFGLPNLGLKMTAGEAALLAMVVNLGAYSTEIVRAGIQVTPKGQWEAGRVLGLSRTQTFVVVKFFWTRRSDGRVMHRRATGRQGWPAFRTVRVIGSQVLNAIGYCYKS